MKKKIFVMISASVLLFSACSSNQATTTSTVTEVTTVATTTEATTTTIAEKPEEYANVEFWRIGELDNLEAEVEAFASEFNFEGAKLYKDEKGEYVFPNYPAGQDIVITFKSEKKYVTADIQRYPYPGDKESPEHIWICDYLSDDPETNDTSKYLTYKDDKYILIIPAKYVEKGNQFRIGLYSKDSYGLFFSVCCK